MCSSYLPTKCCRSLFPSTFPGPIWAIDVVKARYPTFNSKILVVVARQLLTSQLLQAICILRLLSPKMLCDYQFQLSSSYKCALQSIEQSISSPGSQQRQSLHPAAWRSAHLCRPGLVFPEATTLHLCLQLYVFRIYAGTRSVK